MTITINPRVIAEEILEAVGENVNNQTSVLAIVAIINDADIEDKTLEIAELLEAKNKKRNEIERVLINYSIIEDGYTIITNKSRKRWNSDTITYNQIIELIYGVVDSDVEYTIKYKKRLSKGSVVKRQSISVEDGMRFTTKSKYIG